MRRWRAIVPIILAVLVASTASMYLYKWMQAQTSKKTVVKVVESEAVPIAVTTVDLVWGTKLTSEMMKSTPYLKESLPPGYFSDLEALRGRVLTSHLKANEPILESKLAPSSVTTGGVAAVVTPGKRALAVKGNKVIGISGFIRPGNRVDVLVTLKDPRTKKETTKIVLENVLVLAAGPQIEENEKGEPSPVGVYTLEVSPEEAERLALISTKGALRFALRNVTDSETVLTKGETIPKTLSAYRPPVPPAVKRARATVQVIKGGEVHHVKF